MKALDPLALAERAMQLAWTRRLATEADALNAFLDENLSDNLRQIATSTADAKALIAKIELTDVQGYDWDWWAKYGPEVTEELTAAIRVSMLKEFPGMSEVMANELAAEYATTRGARLLRLDGDLNIVNATRARVNLLVARTIEQGDSLQTLQKSLREDLAFSPAKARTVARTETATAQGQGGKQAAMAQGFNEKRWITQGDDAVDANGMSTPCLDNESQGWIKLGNPFTSGHDTIPAHPNCRCTVLYREPPTSDVDPFGGLSDDIASGIAGSRGIACPTCHKITHTLNRDGMGYWCRRCNDVVLGD